MARRPRLRAPFPFFGGKSRVAADVWRAFGDCPNYVEPFFGSGAVLLGRPSEPKIETVNDADAYIANFYRALQQAPEEVARIADWPVNEIDLHARHRWLVGQMEFRERMRTDPDYCDPKVAGWWVWGICQWIGDGWCRPQSSEAEMKKRPVIDGSHAGRGVHRQMKKKIPSLKNGGIGVHMPSLGNDRGIHGVAAPPCSEWFAELQSRLRRVRVACGDWARVLGPSVLGKGKNVGGRRPCAVFLDPPYSHDFREGNMYVEDEKGLSVRVREWAIVHGDDPELRIALCGYEGEHSMPPTWAVHTWKAHRGYAGEDNHNATRERVWFSPHCLPVDSQQGLFGESQ